VLKSLTLKNFTVFGDETFRFGKHLNVVVGENGLGKSHVLQAAYTALSVSVRGPKDGGSSSPTKSYLQRAMAQKLVGVFRPDALGRLARRQASRVRSELAVAFDRSQLDLGISFHSASKSEVVVEKLPSQWEDRSAVYLPTRELLTIYPGFVSLYDEKYTSFEETWRDTCVLLGSPAAKGPREAKVKKVLEPIERAMGGKVTLDPSGRFYLTTKSGKIEIHLVAEGLRKLAMLARLVATGAVLDNGYLFWDEPEANLNPALIREVAATILQLSQSGIQVFVATHSLYLLREIHLGQWQSGDTVEARYFGLHDSDLGTTVTQGGTVDQIGRIRSLEEDLTQSERYLDADMLHRAGVPG